MAYSAYQYSGGILYPEHASQIVIDSSADLADIDLDVVAPGTRVVDCSSGSMYILSPSKQWKLVQNDVAAAANSVVKESASGDIAVISDGANDVAVKSLVAEITPVQSGSGDPSPTNIRPISGRTGLTVTRAGKNLLAQTDVARTVNGVTFTPLADGGYHISGTATANIYYIIYGGFESDAVPAPSYLVNGVQYVGSIDSNKCNLQIYLYGQGRYWQNAPFTVNRDVITACGIFLYVVVGTTIDEDVHPQIEVGSTATAYEPYAGQTYPITWESSAGTVYGGTLDVVSGVLTVDRAIVDMGTLTWAKATHQQGYIYFRAQGGTDMQVASSSSVAQPILSSNYPTQSWNNTVDNASYDKTIAEGWSGQRHIVVRDSTYDDSEASAFKTAMNGVQLLYPLATPQTYQLTPTEVRTLLGGNTIYTDAGDVSVEYVADTKLYIDNQIAELQALILEN